MVSPIDAWHVSVSLHGMCPCLLPLIIYFGTDVPRCTCQAFHKKEEKVRGLVEGSDASKGAKSAQGSYRIHVHLVGFLLFFLQSIFKPERENQRVNS